MYARACACLALCALAAADLLPRQTVLPQQKVLPRQTPAPTTTAASAPEVTAISGCHFHGSQLFCLAGETEYLVQSTPTQTTDIPAQFTGCHHHGSDMYCIGPDGEDVEVEPQTDDEAGGHDHDSDHGAKSDPGANKHCHFHAGVEHCVGGDEKEDAAPNCDAVKRDYNIGLRVGLLFAILATSALGVFGPIFLQRIMPRKLNLVFIVLKQFGTGIIISTAFVHLYTHASLMFRNKCIGNLDYEGTTSAIVIAGLFLSFIIEYIGHRIVLAKQRSSEALSPEERGKAILSSEVVSILVMECGILFHSLLIGLTLVVAGDSFFLTLFVVIVFHQVFEGVALGTRIATIGTRDQPELVQHNDYVRENGQDTDKSTNSPTEELQDITSGGAPRYGLSMKKKLGLASLFAFITPIGMAIGIGVLHHFNGNDKSTLIAMGTLDALSAGVLVWVGVVEMWAADWMIGSHGHKAELADADMLTVALAGTGLVAGLVLMSLLGKWA